MWKPSKVFTFRFYFTWPDGREDETEFCATSRDQAMCLYIDWCRNDMDANQPAHVDSIEVVYNEDDAKEYGSDYGSPSDYEKQTRK